jgi:hypothetical protein
MRPLPGWRVPLHQARLLILSPSRADQQRIASRLAGERNASVASALFIVYAKAGASTELLSRRPLGKAVLGDSRHPDPAVSGVTAVERIQATERAI